MTAIFVDCERSVAYKSPDYIQPWGTKQDNSTNKFFNKKLYKLYGIQKNLKILDLGCSGGGFVKMCHDDGHFAIGLEGNDVSKKNKRAEWASIPERLFTCDVTGKFNIYKNKNDSTRIKFNVITSWELIEHIAECDLKQLAENVKNHLSNNGLWIMSISPNEEIINGVRLHQSVHNKPWWINTFRRLGFINKEKYVKYFNTQFVRGPKYGAGGSFHLVLTLPKNKLPPIPKETILQRMTDKYRGSKLQKALRFLVLGE